MNATTMNKFEESMKSALKSVLEDYSIDDLKKLDWCSLNPDFYIEQDKEKKAA